MMVILDYRITKHLKNSFAEYDEPSYEYYMLILNVIYLNKEIKKEDKKWKN